jgi:hypothetical protein
MNPDDLKTRVREGLVAMTIAEREIFLRALETDMKEVGVNIRAYLVPLGIPGRSAEDLTPNEVGHLLRYLKINQPKALPAIARSINRSSAFTEKTSRPMAA